MEEMPKLPAEGGEDKKNPSPAPVPAGTLPSPLRARRWKLVISALGALLILGVVLITTSSPPLAKPPAHIASSTPATGLRYLLFEIQNYVPPVAERPVAVYKAFFPAYTGSLTDMHAINAYATSKAAIEDQVTNLTAAIKERGDHTSTQLGFVAGPLAFDLTDDEIRRIIDDSFAVAEEKDIAVGFHIDDSMFWINRKDLWSNPDNVEWSDWQGTVVPHRLIAWAAGSSPDLAPPMCYTSPAMEAEAKRRAALIGTEIKKGMDHLKTIGKEYLFAGVIADWEPHLKDDHSFPYGYCALHNLGYSAVNPPKDFNKALTLVMNDWLILWAKGLVDAGIPKEMVHTHITFAGEKTVLEALRQQFYLTADPDTVAFNEYSTPGFSLYSTRHASELYDVLASHGNPAWGISEGNQEDLESGGKPLTSMETYLAAAYNHGATYVDIFGWLPGLHSPDLQGPEPIQAYQTFLSGKALSE